MEKNTDHTQAKLDSLEREVRSLRKNVIVLGCAVAYLFLVPALTTASVFLSFAVIATVIVVPIWCCLFPREDSSLDNPEIPPDPWERFENRP